MSPEGPPEERVIYRQRFQAQYFDFRGKSIFTRYDGCELVKCTLLIDHGTFQARVAHERLGKTIDEIPCGHLVALSHPRELAEVLLAYVAK